jgi:alkanesulfonate monooxygenase SsuD/methylene tetrahydromethanopterin reductase-like flavin-dependent oxidoreductase (luciferase family)
VPDHHHHGGHGPQVHLGVFFTGVGPQLIWADPASAAHHQIETFVQVAQLLERGLFDAFFLGEGLRVRENRGKVFDLDVSGRPDAITQLAALATVTERIGLVATQNATYNYPADLARRLASLDFISGGRAGWNIVTTDNAWTGENFRHGGWLPHERRYERATQFVEAAKELWEAGPGSPPVEVRTDLVSFRAAPTAPPSPQGRPVLFQAGDSAGGRDLAARHADVVFSRHREYEEAVEYGPRALAYLEQYWGTDLSAYDPDGPLPDIEPSDGELDPSRGTIAIERRTGKHALIQGWRDLAAERGLSIRQLVLAVSEGHATFTGTPGQIADTWAHYVRSRAVDGFNITPHLLPSSLADIVDKVVPELQDRGVYRTQYEGTTLREHLALPSPRPAVAASTAG